MSILAEFGIDSVGEVIDPAPQLALDDALRAHEPAEVLLSALYDTRFGLTRKDLVEWARELAEPEVKFTHIPVRVEDDSIRLGPHPRAGGRDPDGQRAGPGRPAEGARRRRARTATRSICPRSEDVSEEQVVRDLASTLAELYRADVDATGQPISSRDPFEAVRNAIEHYKIDEILISTFAGSSRAGWRATWSAGSARSPTSRSSHVEVGRAPAAVAAAVAEGDEH